MNFLPDSLATGVPFVLGGAGAVLASLPERYKVAEWIATYLFVLFVCLGAWLEGVDVPVPWQAFVETCFALWAVLFLVPFVQAARRSKAGADASR